MIGAGKDTVFVIDDREHLFAGLVAVSESLLLNDLPCFGCHLRQQIRQELADDIQFFIGDRTSCIALHTARAVTGVEVATELFLDDIE